MFAWLLLLLFLLLFVARASNRIRYWKQRLSWSNQSTLELRMKKTPKNTTATAYSESNNHFSLYATSARIDLTYSFELFSHSILNDIVLHLDSNSSSPLHRFWRRWCVGDIVTLFSILFLALSFYCNGVDTFRDVFSVLSIVEIILLTGDMRNSADCCCVHKIHWLWLYENIFQMKNGKLMRP